MSHSPTSVAEAGAPPHQRGLETCVLILALLLRLSLGILPLPPTLLVRLAGRAVRRARRPSLWYLSEADRDEYEALSPRQLRMVRRHLAAIAWILAGTRNHGMRPHARITSGLTPGLSPACGARAPPLPA